MSSLECPSWIVSQQSTPFTHPLRFASSGKTCLPLDTVVQVITPTSDGNGFLVGTDGWVLTPSHVVDGYKTVWMALANGDILKGAVVAANPEWDCALLKIEAPYRLPVARIGSIRNISIGKEVVVVGWDPGDYLAKSPGAIPLRITQVNAPLIGVSIPVFNAAGSSVVRPGFSGSPACCPRTGHVLGMYCWSRASTDLTHYVPADVLKAFLREHGICNNRSASRTLPSSGDEGMARRAEKYTAWRIFYIPCVRREGFGDLDAMQKSPDLFANRWMLDHLVKEFEEFEAGWAARAAVRWAQGEQDGAREDARHALSIGPDFLAYSVLYKMASERADWEEAIQIAQEWLTAFRSVAENEDGLLDKAYHSLCDALLHAGRPKEALHACQDAQEGKAGDWVMYCKAMSFEALGLIQEAKEAYEQTLLTRSRCDRIRFRLMGVLISLGGEDNYRKALGHALLAQAQMEDLPQGFYGMLGHIYGTLGWNARAQDMLRLEALLFPRPSHTGAENLDHSLGWAHSEVSAQPLPI